MYLFIVLNLNSLYANLNAITFVDSGTSSNSEESYLFLKSLESDARQLHVQYHEYDIQSHVTHASAHDLASSIMVICTRMSPAPVPRCAAHPRCFLWHRTAAKTKGGRGLSEISFTDAVTDTLTCTHIHATVVDYNSESLIMFASNGSEGVHIMYQIVSNLKIFSIILSGACHMHLVIQTESEKNFKASKSCETWKL